MIGEADVKALPAFSRHSKAVKATAHIEHNFTHLGFMKIVAIANGVAPVHEAAKARANNKSRPKGNIAVIPQKWKVPEFDTAEHPPGMPKKETFPGSTLGFAFSKYERADEAYESVVNGSVQARYEGSFQGACTVSGHGLAAHTPWKTPESQMLLYQTLRAYRAKVFASKEEPFEAPLNCPGGAPIPDKETFQDLITEGNGSFNVPMTPTEKTLQDSVVYREIEFYWQFDAEIAGEPTPPPPPPPPA